MNTSRRTLLKRALFTLTAATHARAQQRPTAKDRTASGFCWAALANFRETGVDTGGALDGMMWDIVRQVPNWHA